MSSLSLWFKAAPTANGQVCQIPYSSGGVDYYHCRSFSNECLTTSGTFAKCANGHFQYARPSPFFNPYTVEFLFPTITLPEPGEYLAKFHILMFCEQEGCDEAQDYLSFTVNDVSDGNATLVYKEYSLKNIEMEKKWIPREVKFRAATQKINVRDACYALLI